MTPSKRLLFAALPLLTLSLGGCTGDGFEPIAELDEPADSVARRSELPCNGAREARSLGVFAPKPPSDYADEVPDCADANVACVSPATLQDEVDAGTEIIVLADGVYTSDALDGAFLTIDGQELWAQNRGGAVLEFGIEAGGNGIQHMGARLRGLVCN